MPSISTISWWCDQRHLVSICAPLEKLAIIYQVAGGDELNKGAMAQLVARFHGMEEVGGSNPPSSTEKTDTRLVSVGFCYSVSLVVTFFSLACSLLRF